jgi:hypothetical protein
MKALVRTQEKPIARGTPKATTITAPLLTDATNTNQQQFPVREPNVSQVAASPPCSTSRKIIIIIIIITRKYLTQETTLHAE